MSNDPSPSTDRTQRAGPFRGHVLPLLIYLAGYYILTFPALHDVATHLFADRGDGYQNFWNNWWVRRAVANGQNPWFTDYLFAPEGVTLIGATLNPFNGFATVVLCWFVNAVLAYNLTVVFAFVAGGYTTYLLARELTGTYWPSVFAGAVFTFSPYHFAHAIGHMQLVSLQFLPFFFWAWVRFLSAPSHGRALLAAVALFLNLLCDYYYTLYSILGGALLFVIHGCATRRPLFLFRRPALLPTVTFVAAALVMCGPILFHLIATNAADPMAGRHDSDSWVNDLFALWIPAGNWRFAEWTEWYWSLHPGMARSELSSNLGVAVSTLAILGIFGARVLQRASVAWTWLIVGAVFFLLSLGPRLLVLGESYSFPMPYAWLDAALPFLDLSGMPIRMTVMTNLAAAVLSAMGVHYLACRPRRRWPMLLLFGLCAFETWPRPQVRTRPHIPESVRKLRDLPDGIVAGLEPDWSLMLQTCFEKPMSTGYVARIPGKMEKRRKRQELLRKAGDYDTLMRETGATYLLLDVWRSPNVLAEEGLKLVIADPRYPVYVRRDNPLPAADGAIVSVSRGPGRVEIQIESAGDAGRPYLGLFSAGMSEPREFLNGVFCLKESELLRMSSKSQGPFAQNRGKLSSDGRAKVVVDTTALLEEADLWFCFVVLRNVDPLIVNWISAPYRVRMTK